eukprot:GHVN01041435.1.p2 GENE.GHVN01041435.1~~GHVN01041435.1.p2  ORF type:complete len:231 (+),score=28.91 GHVN01041435.1:1332-2024(+)
MQTQDVKNVGCTVKSSEGLGEETTVASVLRRLRMRMLIEGNVPQAAGVSSSSSMVVASFLAIARELFTRTDELTQSSKWIQKWPSRRTVADICCNCERHVGTAGGGMDQSAICLSKPGQAQLISFSPLCTKAISLPSNTVFVVTNSQIVAPKAESAHKMYNKRVFELRLASYTVLKAESPKSAYLSAKDLPALTFRVWQEALKLSLSVRPVEPLFGVTSMVCMIGGFGVG